MRSTPRYPVDRYMVENSKNIEMVNIIGDDLWKPEPTLRPEDEIILRKLHDMLQSTSDDLKLLSGELSKFHEPGVQIKTVPTPLDEEFNEKVHIEELVNAKFHGYKIVDKSTCVPEAKVSNDTIHDKKPPTSKPLKPKVTNSAAQMNSIPVIKIKQINRNLGISRTKIIQINEKNQDNMSTQILNNGKIVRNAPAIAYNEFSYKYVESDIKEIPQKKFQVQVMPSINIRSELKEQRVLNIDILPDSQKKTEVDPNRTNVAVVAVSHEEPPKQVPVKTRVDPILNDIPNYIKPVRKVSKLSTGDSSESTNISSDARLTLKTHNKLSSVIRESPRNSARLNRRKKPTIVKEPEKRQTHNLEEWRRKLNIVYGTSTSKNIKSNLKSKNVGKKVSPKRLSTSTRTGMMNNAEYIPYSKLTLGGVRVSDIEKEISDIPNKNNKPLSQILDKILSSTEHSPRNLKSNDIPKVLTTSDENLLQEVIDIERTVSGTISKNISTKEIDKTKDRKPSNEDDKNESYADDFEDDKSDHTNESENDVRINNSPGDNYSKEGNTNDNDSNSDDSVVDEPHNLQNTTFTKTSNLSIKDSVDVFEFIHSVKTQDIATQSNGSNKIFPKETQTSPRNDKPNIQPIHNDLWPSIDAKGEVERMLKLEKEFIKKLILDEFGDLLDKNITKPSTSKESVDDSENNVAASQKNTQTSPACVKSVMTSPKRTKTRTTSPFAQQLTVTADHQTSPIILDITEEVNVENQDITINLSSPRFNLRLPQTLREVLSNIDAFSQASSRIVSKSSSNKFNASSSSSVEAGSSSELSSIGEVRLNIKKKLKKSRVPSISESSSSSALSKYSFDLPSGGIIPLRSDGEVSLGQRTKKMANKSEGETSVGVFQ